MKNITIGICLLALLGLSSISYAAGDQCSVTFAVSMSGNDWIGPQAKYNLVSFNLINKNTGENVRGRDVDNNRRLAMTVPCGATYSVYGTPMKMGSGLATANFGGSYIYNGSVSLLHPGDSASVNFAPGTFSKVK